MIKYLNSNVFSVLSQLTYDSKTRIDQEEEKYMLADKKRQNRRADLLLESQRMIEERMKLKSRKDYSRHIQTMNRDIEGEPFQCNPSEAEKFSEASEQFKEAKQRLDNLSRSLQRKSR